MTTIKCINKLLASKNWLVNLIIFYCFLQLWFPPPLFFFFFLENYRLAREHDPLFRSYFYENEAAKTLPKQGRALLLPQIQAQGIYAKYHYDTGPYHFEDFTSETMGISLRQPLMNIPKMQEYRQTKIRAQVGATRFVLAEQDLILRLSEAYFSALAAKNVLDLIKAEKKAVNEQQEQARRRFQAGIATITDVHDAEARYDLVLAQEIEANSELAIRMQALKRLVGIQPASLASLKKEVPVEVAEYDSLEELLEKAKKYHPRLKYYAQQIEYQEMEVKKTKGQHWPSIDLVAGYNKTNTNNAVIIPNLSYGTVGMQVSVPIFSGGYTAAKVSEAQALLAKVKEDYDNAWADITQKLNEAFLGLLGSKKKIAALLTAQKSAQTSLQSNQMSLQAGIKTTIEVLNAERELQLVRTRLLKARYDSLLYLVRLKASAGTLSVDDVYEINQWLHE